MKLTKEIFKNINITTSHISRRVQRISKADYGKFGEGEENEKSHSSGGLDGSSYDPRPYLSRRERLLWDRASDYQKQKAIKEGTRKSGATSTTNARGSKSTSYSRDGASKEGTKIAYSGGNLAKASPAMAKGGSAAVATKASAAVPPVGAVVAVASVGKKIAEAFQDNLKKSYVSPNSKKDFNEFTSMAGTSRTPSTVEASTQNTSSAAAKIIAALVPLIIVLVKKIAVFAVISLIIALISLIVMLFSSTETQRRGLGGANRFIEIAEQEYANASENIGGFKYKAWFGMNDHWCAIFIAWVGYEAGFERNEVIPHTASVRYSEHWFRGRGLFYPASSMPEPGDIVHFCWGTRYDHVAIVVEVVPERNMFYTIGGNEGSSHTADFHSGSTITRTPWFVGHRSITGFGRPPFPGLSFYGDTYREIIFNALRSTGYSNAAAAAMVGNIARETGLCANGDIMPYAVESNGIGHGILQWSFGRRDELFAFGAARGESWPISVETQIEFMLLELDRGNQWFWTNYANQYGAQHNISYQEWRNSTDVAFATTVVNAKFIRPAFWAAALDIRIHQAQITYDRYAR